MKKTEFKPDFAKAYNLATEILLTSNCFSKFPYQIKDLVKDITDISCCSYKKALKYGIQAEIFGSDSASIQDYEGMNIIFYNQEDPKPRIRFSIAHELGHYLLCHKKGFNLDGNLYEKQEIETNCFAAQLLMPEQLLTYFTKNFIRIDTNFLMTNFGVSEEASQKRLKTLKSKIKRESYKNFNKDSDDSVVYKFQDFLNSVMAKYNKNTHNYNYDCEEEYRRQQERNSWF